MLNILFKKYNFVPADAKYIVLFQSNEQRLRGYVKVSVIRGHRWMVTWPGASVAERNSGEENDAAVNNRQRRFRKTAIERLWYR